MQLRAKNEADRPPARFVTLSELLVEVKSTSASDHRIATMQSDIEETFIIEALAKELKGQPTRVITTIIGTPTNLIFAPNVPIRAFRKTHHPPFIKASQRRWPK